MNNFIHKFIKKKDDFISTTRIYAFYCVLYDIDTTNLSLKKFVKDFKEAIKLVFDTDLVTIKKRSGKKSVRGFVGISVPLLMEQDYIDRLVEAEHKLTQKRNTINNNKTPYKKESTTFLKNNQISGTSDEPYAELINFVKSCKPGTKSKENIVPTNILYEEYLQTLSNEEGFISKSHFTNKFNEVWKIVYPNSKLVSGLRDPNNRAKRAVGYIQR